MLSQVLTAILCKHHVDIYMSESWGAYLRCCTGPGIPYLMMSCQFIGAIQHFPTDWPYKASEFSLVGGKGETIRQFALDILISQVGPCQVTWP